MMIFIVHKKFITGNTSKILGKFGMLSGNWANNDQLFNITAAIKHGILDGAV
jgi:hypothetical protein